MPLPRTPLRVAAALLVSFGGAARAGLFGGDATETAGPFEIGAGVSSHWVGAWESRSHVTRYTVRHRGSRVTVPGRPAAGRPASDENEFQAVYILDTTPPALLVRAGYPQAASHFHLLREIAGRLQVDYLAPVARPGGDGQEPATVEWLDGSAIELPAATGKKPAPAVRLSGGRWLLVGLYGVLDVATLQFQALPLPPERPYEAGVFMRSPDGRNFVRRAHGDEFPTTDYLVVLDRESAASYSVPVDRRRMRYSAYEDLEQPGWLAHHFEWRKKGAAYRLAERASFEPWPIGGTVHDGPRGAQYELEGAGPQAGPQFVRFVKREFKGREVPHTDPAAARADGGETIEEWTYVVVGGTTLATVTSDRGDLQAWKHRGDDALARRVLEAFDQAVRAGRIE